MGTGNKLESFIFVIYKMAESTSWRLFMIRFKVFPCFGTIEMYLNTSAFWPPPPYKLASIRFCYSHIVSFVVGVRIPNRLKLRKSSDSGPMIKPSKSHSLRVISLICLFPAYLGFAHPKKVLIQQSFCSGITLEIPRLIVSFEKQMRHSFKVLVTGS